MTQEGLCAQALLEQAFAIASLPNVDFRSTVVAFNLRHSGPARFIRSSFLRESIQESKRRYLLERRSFLSNGTSEPLGRMTGFTLSSLLLY